MSTLGRSPRAGRYAARLALATVLGVAGLLVAVSPGATDSGEGVVAATERVQRLASLGTQHSCAITGKGEVECWGDNAFGQLGTGDHATRTTPQLVSGITGAIQVASGTGHTCALIHGGSVKCWGLNGSGQLGDGTDDDRSTPVDVTGLDDVRRLVAGDFHNCALIGDGSVRCWGQDGMGQLGDEDPGDFATEPVEVLGLDPGDPVVDLAAGEWHSCARTDAGKLRCWGHNEFGQLGDNTEVGKATATPVVDPDDFTQQMTDVLAVTAGAGHTCAVLDRPNRPTYCWGMNTYGQLGHATDLKPDPDDGMKDSPLPLRVQVDENPDGNALAEDELADPMSISAGAFHTCSVVPGAAVVCWGQNDHGQLGFDPKPLTKQYENSRWGQEVPGVTAGGAVAGGFHTCAVSGGGMSCWGYDFYGQLGGHDAQVETPTLVTGVTGARKVAVATNAVCAMLVDNLGPEDTTPYCWGDNDDGRLGSGSATDPDQTTVRIPVVGTTFPDDPELGIGTDLRAGNGTFCAVPDGSGRVCWGLDASGEIGDEATADRPSPVASTHLAGATAYDLGGTRVGTDEKGTTCKVASGEVRCWGYNGQGQLGDGTTDDSTSPQTVLFDANGDDDGGETPVTGATAVAVGGDHACAIVAGGQVRCWGSNTVGQLGDNTVDPRQYAVLVQEDISADPEDVDPLDGVTALVAGDSHTCALLGDQTVRCWGLTGSGQLGRSGSGRQANLPVRWQPPLGPGADLGGVTRIVSGDDHTCALRADESLVCWGENSENQLGAGSGDSNVGLVVLEAPDLDSDEEAALEGQAWIQDVAAGRNNTCAVMLDRTVSCWGDNTFGQVGDGIGRNSLAPVTVGGDGTFAQNDIPLPPHLTAETTPGTPVDIPVTLVGTDPDNAPSPTSLTGVEDPAKGTATVEAPATIRYEPDPGCQDDTFAYFVSDGLATVAGKVTVTMNCAPVPAADTASTSEDTAVDIDVLANDTDEDGDTLTIDSIGAQPVHGSAAVVAGQVRYTPDADYCSPPKDTFTYRVDDGHGHVVEAPVTVTVSCGNDGPATGADAVSTPEETELVIPVLANDGDVDGDPLTVQSVADAAHGTTSTNGTTVRYLPDANYCGPDSFTYVVSDGVLTANGSVDVAVTCAGDSPRATRDDVATTEDTSLLVDVVANDTDPDAGDTLSVTAALGAPQHGTVAVESGKVRYTPAADYCGLDSFTYVVEDSGGLTDTGRVDVRVTCAPDAPVAAPDVASTPEDTTVHVHVLVNDTDVDGDTLSVAGLADPANQPSHGTIAGAITNAVAYTPKPDFCGLDSFGYDAVDPSGLVSHGIVSVTVECVDDPVALSAVPDQTTPWGLELGIPLVATDRDGEPIAFSIASGPTGGGAAVVGSTFTWTPQASQVGTHDITVRASSGGAHADRTFRVAVQKRGTTLVYDGSVSGQVSDPAPVSAVLRDAVTGLPVGGRTVRFTLGGTTVTAPSEGTTGRASTLMPVAPPVGPKAVQSTFTGDPAYTGSSASSTFTAAKEAAQVSLAGQPHVVVSGASTTVTYVADLAEVEDGTYAGALSGASVAFRKADGTTICTATASTTTAGRARATCQANQAVGAQAVIVAATSPSYTIPADVGVVTVANSGSGFVSGAGRAQGDAFGFQARPVRRAAPQGNAVHVVHSGGTATVVATSSLADLTRSCTKAKVCSAQLTGAVTSYTTVELTSGAPTPTTDTGTGVVVDVTDPNRYGVQLTGGVARSIPTGTLISSGQVRVAP